MLRKILMRLPVISCEKASRLMSARMDRPLAPWEHVELVLHLAVCDGCREISRQIGFLRLLLGAWRHDLLEESWQGGPYLSREAKDQMKLELTR